LWLLTANPILRVNFHFLGSFSYLCCFVLFVQAAEARHFVPRAGTMTSYQPINTGVANDELDPSSPVSQSRFSSSSDDKESDAAFSPPSSPPAIFSPDKGKAALSSQLLSSPPVPPRSPFRPTSAVGSRIAHFEANAQTTTSSKAKSARRDEPVYNPFYDDLKATSRPQTPAPVRDYSETLLGSPGPSRWHPRVRNETQEGSEVNGSPDGMIGRLPSWEHSGIARRTSLARPTEEEEEEEAESLAHWSGVQEAGDRFLRNDERGKSYFFP
jgi:hypothetical protein